MSDYIAQSLIKARQADLLAEAQEARRAHLARRSRKEPPAVINLLRRLRPTRREDSSLSARAAA
jgi:hypothetical protein